MDDDIEPDERLLQEYYIAISGHPNARGFVGLSQLPFDDRPWTNAIHAASTTFFWYIAEWAATNGRPAPWGVTANLCTRWHPDLRFNLAFAKTGGGEDIDLCIQAGHHLVPAPLAKVRHPWRASRRLMWIRIFQWAISDGRLVQMHPRFTFRTLPTAPEWLVIVSTWGAILTMLGSVYAPVVAVSAWSPLWAVLITAVPSSNLILVMVCG